MHEKPPLHPTPPDLPPTAPRTRLPGLDTLRALAIALVFCYHYEVFVSRTATFGWLSDVGWVGVDLFFVLSGYLITAQVLSAQDRAPGCRLSLASFYARRALRTWPLFWLVLAAYLLWPGPLGGRTPPPAWRFLSFTQNWQLQPGTAFSHAWSLCVEEQFYLLLLLVLLAAWRWGRRRREAWLLIAGLTTAATLWRAVVWMRFGRADFGEISGYHPNLYYASVCRFDELLPGVAVALLQHRHPALWSAVRRHGRSVFAAGLAATLPMLWLAMTRLEQDGYGWLPFMSIVGYPLLAGAFALLLMSALCPTSPLARVRVPGATALAAWSYPVYLSHKAVANLVHRQATGADWPAGVEPGLILAASLLTGWLLHRLIERPVQAWRDRHLPPLFRPSGRPAVAWMPPAV